MIFECGYHTSGKRIYLNNQAPHYHYASRDRQTSPAPPESRNFFSRLRPHDSLPQFLDLQYQNPVITGQTPSFAHEVPRDHPVALS